MLFIFSTVLIIIKLQILKPDVDGKCLETTKQAMKVIIPVCGNQCKAAGDVDSTCSETRDGGYNCACSSGFSAEKGVCEDIDECEAKTSSCEYGNCMNNDGSYECAAETGLTYSGVFQSASGNFESITLQNFKLFPIPTGSGSDATGKFEIVDAVTVNKNDHREQTIEFTKEYDDGAREKVHFEVVVGAAGIAGKHTTFTTDDNSFSGSLTLEVTADQVTVENAEMTKVRVFEFSGRI